MRRLLDRLRQEEEGFTILEILVASIILVLASLAVFMTLAAAVKNTQRSRESQIAISVAQREMERVRVIPFDSIRLNSTPARVVDSRSPYFRIPPGSAVAPEFDVVRSGSSPEYQPLLVPDDGIEALPEVEVETPGVRADDGTEVTVYRFVTCEEEDLLGSCIAKRVIIDVQLAPKTNLGNLARNYYELQSTVTELESGEEP
ncbi:MAG TPA: hypothetical protein VD761_03385 [Solirubrobacterales bacterium]|nr:hypothetical protein [Solirubrobacterales bacterium]